MKRTLTKGERLVAEMCGDLPVDGYPVLLFTTLNDASFFTLNGGVFA